MTEPRLVYLGLNKKEQADLKEKMELFLKYYDLRAHEPYNHDAEGEIKISFYGDEVWINPANGYELEWSERTPHESEHKRMVKKSSKDVSAIKIADVDYMIDYDYLKDPNMI